MADPRRLFQSKDVEAACLYAKKVTETAGEDASPLIIDASGYLLINMTVGTVTLSGTASTINNAVGNPANVSLTNTKVTIESSGGFSVNVATATLGTVTITGNVNIATATLGTVTVALSSTVVTVANTLSTVTIIAGQSTVAGGIGATGATVQRVVLANDQGRTLTASSGTLSATQVTLVLAGSNKTKVYAFSLTTTSTTGVICSFMHGSQSGPELWRVLLQAPSGANSGANLAVTPPGYLFATPSAGNLILFLSAAVRVDFSVAYYDEA